MSQPEFQISIVSDLQEFRDLERPWNRMADSHPMLSWDWMFSWWEQFQEGNDLLILLVKNQDNQIVGIVPWFKTITRGGARVIRSIGCGDACTDYMEIICEEHNRSNIESIVAESVFSSKTVQRRMARWDWIEIDGHTNGSFDSFFDRMKAHGSGIYQQELESSWVTDLIAPFDDFEATLKRSFRRKTRKATKNLANSQIAFEIFDETEDLIQLWKSFCMLHQKRRKVLGQAGCFKNPAFEAFLLNSTRRLMHNGRAKIARTQVDGKDIAFVLIFQTKDTIWKYQSGMCPEASHWEPGHMVTTALVKYAIDQGCTRYDFLRGNEPYKRFWNSVEHPLYKSRVISPRATSRFRHNVWLTGKTVKQRLTSLRFPLTNAQSVREN